MCVYFQDATLNHEPEKSHLERYAYRVDFRQGWFGTHESGICFDGGVAEECKFGPF